MWLIFVAALVVCALVMYAPGYLLGRAVRIQRFAAVAIAPVFSAFVYVVAGVGLAQVHVSCPAWMLLAGVVAFSAAVFGIGKAVAMRGKSDELVCVASQRETGKIALVYIGVALLITCIVFLLAIDGPESFSRNDDTTVHLSAVRMFLETGAYSILNVSSYPYAGGFYPAAWHVMVAIVASLFGNSVTLATNAATVVVIVLVLPLGFALLFDRLFDGSRRLVLAGALFVPAFCGFPWGFIVFGQLFPNMLAWTFIPAVLVLLMDAIEAQTLSARVRQIVCAVVGLCAIAVAQPNGVFTFGIWAVLYGVSRFFFEPGAVRATVTTKRVVGAVVLFAAACLVWVGMFVAPPLQSVVTYTWEKTLSVPEAIICSLAFMFSDRQGIQPFLSVVVLLGVIYALRNRRYLWLVVAYAFAELLFVMDASTDGFFKQLLSGFWYTDYRRTGAMAAFFAIPLATMGFAWLAQLCTKLVDKLRGKSSIKPVVAVLVAVFLAVQFAPIYLRVGKVDVYSGLVQIRNEITWRYSWDEALTREEDAFIKKVMEQIPADAVVVNLPNDGSCWSHGVEGLNAYYRRAALTGMGYNQDAKAIRLGLANVTSDPAVQQALKKANAQYLIVLDDPAADNRTLTSVRWEPKNWVGIEAVTPETPGFTLLMSEGDMRLYRIDAVL